MVLKEVILKKLDKLKVVQNIINIDSKQKSFNSYTP